MRDSVFIDSISKEIRVGFDITHVHRVDSFYLRIVDSRGEKILEKRYSKADSSIIIEDTSRAKRNMDWDTLIRLGCEGDYDAYVVTYMEIVEKQ